MNSITGFWFTIAATLLLGIMVICMPFLKMKSKGVDENMIYYCPECELVFDEPAQYHYESGDLPPVIIKECPHCGAKNFVRALRCDGCGYFITGKYVRTRYDDVFCEDCYVQLDINDPE